MNRSFPGEVSVSGMNPVHDLTAQSYCITFAGMQMFQGKNLIMKG